MEKDKPSVRGRSVRWQIRQRMVLWRIIMRRKEFVSAGARLSASCPVKKDGVALPKKQKMIIGEDDQRILEQIDALRKELQELREESANLRKELEAVRAGQEKA